MDGKTKMRFPNGNFKKIIGIDCLNPLIEQAQKELKDNVFSFHTCDVIDADFTENLRRIMQQQKIDAFDIIHCSFVLMQYGKTRGNFEKTETVSGRGRKAYCDRSR